VKRPAACFGWLVFFALAGCASPIVPRDIPTDRSALPELTSSLRGRVRSLGLNGPRVSRALVLLPEDRANPGVISFELEDGPRAGAYQCEVLGRGRTSESAEPGWLRGAIGTTTVYYAPMSEADGATPVGLYDVRNISTQTYELAFLDDAGQASPPQPKPYFSAIRTSWYPKDAPVMPIDMIWAEDQGSSQGARFPVRQGRPGAFADRQLAHNPRYYYGPFGRSGLANHTDRWDDPDRKSDPRFAGRRELSDFRWRDTDGCLKVRPDCLELLNQWVAEQAAKGRRTQYEVRQTRRLDRVVAR